MGSRLSAPRGPDGLTEAPHSRQYRSSRRVFNSRQVVAPLAAFSMACVLFVYARTSIRVAKANAQRHRDADSGGQGLDLLSESRRRHGRAERVEDGGGTVTQLARGAREQILGSGGVVGGPVTAKERKANEGKKVPGGDEEARLREAMGRRKDGS